MKIVMDDGDVGHVVNTLYLSVLCKRTSFFN